MKRAIIIIAGVVAAMSVMVSCAPKATGDGVPATGDTVEVNPTEMSEELQDGTPDDTADTIKQVL